MTAFFALIYTCGVFSCDPPRQAEFESEEACVAFAKFYIPYKVKGHGAVCFDRKTGKMLFDSTVSEKK